MLDGRLIPASVGVVAVSSMWTSPRSSATSPSVVSDSGDICVRSCRFVGCSVPIVIRCMVCEIVIVLVNAIAVQFGHVRCPAVVVCLRWRLVASGTRVSVSLGCTPLV
eukprot:3925041-Prorocentrum_lima.AAC.1